MLQVQYILYYCILINVENSMKRDYNRIHINCQRYIEKIQRHK